MDVLQLIAAERRRVADLAETLTHEQLATGSLCGAWTVRDVLAHLLMPLVTSPVAVVSAVLRARGSFDRANVLLTSRLDGLDAPAIAAGLRAHAESRFHPPGMGLEAPLTDLVVHTQDLSRPLGLVHEPPAEALRAVLGFLSQGAPRGFVRKGTIEGLLLEATDLGWSTGSGELVRGRGVDLALALTGRPSALDQLAGPGTAVLAARTG